MVCYNGKDIRQNEHIVQTNFLSFIAYEIQLWGFILAQANHLLISQNPQTKKLASITEQNVCGRLIRKPFAARHHTLFDTVRKSLIVLLRRNLWCIPIEVTDCKSLAIQ